MRLIRETFGLLFIKCFPFQWLIINCHWLLNSSLTSYLNYRFFSFIPKIFMTINSKNYLNSKSIVSYNLMIFCFPLSLFLSVCPQITERTCFSCRRRESNQRSAFHKSSNTTIYWLKTRTSMEIIFEMRFCVESIPRRPIVLIDSPLLLRTHWERDTIYKCLSNQIQSISKEILNNRFEANIFSGF